MVAWSGSTYDMYVDGVSVSSGNAGVTYLPSSSNTYITVGSEIGPVRRWVGQIGHVAIYPTRLTLSHAVDHNAKGRQ